MYSEEQWGWDRSVREITTMLCLQITALGLDFKALHAYIKSPTFIRGQHPYPISQMGRAEGREQPHAQESNEYSLFFSHPGCILPSASESQPKAQTGTEVKSAEPFLLQRESRLILSRCAWRCLWKKTLQKQGSHLLSVDIEYLEDISAKFIPGPGLDAPFMTRRGCALSVFLAVALPALMTLDEKPVRWFLCAGGLEMGRGGRHRDGTPIFNPVPAPAQLVTCLSGALVSQGTIPFKKDTVFSHQADEIDFPQR